jgi:hypothetical protein
MDEMDGGGPAGDQGVPRPALGEMSSETRAFLVGPLDQPLPSEGAPTSPLVFGPPYDSQTPSAQGPAKTHTRRRTAVVSVAALVIIAAGVGGILATSGGSSAPGSGMSPAAFVVTSTQNTVAQKTADVDVSGSLAIDGTTIPVSGSGQANFTTNQFSASIDLSSSQHTVDEKELASGGQVYMDISVDGQGLSSLTGGAQWIQIPVPQQSAGSIGGADVDPISEIKMLEQRGATVVPLGSSTIDGDQVSGYSVTPSQAEIEAGIQQEAQAGQLPASTVSAALKEAKELGTFDVDIWIDGDNLLRQESVTIGGGTSGATGKISLTFQDYGTPVSIQPPAPGSVVSFSQFMNDVKLQDPGQTS